MTSAAEAAGPGEPVSSVDAARLLTLGLSGPQRPVDVLIARLEQPGGLDWFLELLRLLPGPCEDWAGALIDGRLGRQEILALKDSSKSAMAVAPSEDHAMAATAGFILAIAAGLSRHGELLTSRPREELDPVMVDLASTLPAPWSDLLVDAVMTPPGPMIPMAG